MTYKASDLELEMLDPGATGFVRLFGRPNAEWDPPQPAYRVARCDPPDGKKNDYALLYLGDRIEVTAAECGVLSVDRMGNFAYDDAKAKAYRVARYTFDQPAIFIPLDVNRKLLGVDRQPYVPGYGPWQEAAHQLWSRFGKIVHGLSWWSMHRNQIGRVYALWHEHKSTIGMGRPTGPFDKLHEDNDWKAFLASNPSITALKPS